MARIGAAPTILSLLAATCVASALTAANITQRLQSPFGVSALGAAVDGSVWVISREHLIHLSPEGYRLGSWTASEIKVQSPLQALAVTPGGIWLGAGGQLVRIDDAGQVRQRLDPSKTAAGALSNRFQIAFDAKSGRLWVSDHGHRRLLAFDAQGTLDQMGPKLVDPPQGISADKEGRLLVAALGSRALAHVLPGPQLQHWGTTAPDHVRLGHRHPLWVSVKEDAVYASWHDDDLRQGSVMRYDLHGEVVQRLPLPPAVEPQALLARENDLLVAARLPTGHTLLRYEPSNGRLDEFGDADLRWALRQSTREEMRLAQIRTAAVTGLLLSLMLLIVLSVRFWRARKAHRAESLELRDLSAGLAARAAAQEG